MTTLNLILDYSITATIAFSFFYLVIAFGLFVSRPKVTHSIDLDLPDLNNLGPLPRVHPAARSTRIQFVALSACAAVALSGVAAQTPVTALPPVVEAQATEVSSAPDYHAMTSTELRKLCATAGIQWRNARGKNKHLTKAQMIEALSA